MNVGNQLDPDTGEGQIFVQTAKHKGSMVAIKPVRKNKIKLDREQLVEMRHVSLTLTLKKKANGQT